MWFQLRSNMNLVGMKFKILMQYPTNCPVRSGRPQRVALQILTDFAPQPISLFAYFLEYKHNAHYHEKKIVNCLWHKHFKPTHYCVPRRNLTMSLNIELTTKSRCVRTKDLLSIYVDTTNMCTLTGEASND